MSAIKMVLIMAFAALSMAAAWGAAPQEQKADARTHSLKCTLVAVETGSGQVTIRTEDGKERTLPVEGKAVEKLARFHPGEEVLAICRDDEQGQHLAIAGLRRSKPEGEEGQPGGGQGESKDKEN